MVGVSIRPRNLGPRLRNGEEVFGYKSMTTPAVRNLAPIRHWISEPRLWIAGPRLWAPEPRPKKTGVRLWTSAPRMCGAEAGLW